MARVRLLNRNRPQLLWAFSSIAILFPLMLGPSSAGGCGATVTVPSPDPDLGPDETLDEIILDSDGDGFSDELEINSITGTDPDDPTDNPNNIRDTDGDGCSDFDELNFPNFCDNDPYTSTCQTTYYNADMGYGFDLPPDAVLERANDAAGFLFNAGWSVYTEDGGFGAFTNVQDIDDSWTLTAFAEAANQMMRDDGGEFLVEELYVLSNGNIGHLSVWDYQGVGITYRVLTLKDGLKFESSAIVPANQFTNTTDVAASEIVTSLCVD